MRCDWHLEIFGAGWGTDLGHVLGWSKAAASRPRLDLVLAYRRPLHRRYLGTCETRPVEKLPPQIDCQEVICSI